MNSSNTSRLRILLTLWIATATVFSQTQLASPSESTFLTVRELLSSGKYHEAELILRDYTTRDRLSAKAHYLLGYTLLRENRPKDSLAEYTLAASLEQPSAEDLKNVGLTYVLLDDL